MHYVYIFIALQNIATLNRLIRTHAVIAVVLQQLGTARNFAGGAVHPVRTLRRSCEALQMPPHRNVKPANSGTRHVVIVIAGSLIREY